MFVRALFGLKKGFGVGACVELGDEVELEFIGPDVDGIGADMKPPKWDEEGGGEDGKKDCESGS